MMNNKRNYLLFAIVGLMLLTSCKECTHEYNRPINIKSDTISSFSKELFDFLEDPDEFEFLTLDPYISKKKEKNLFHGYKVLGSKVIGKKNERINIVDHFYKAINARIGRKVACFLPRHAFRLQKNKQEINVLICFECDRAEIYDKKNGMSEILLQGKPDYFNSIATKYHLPYMTKPAPNTPKK